MTEKIKINVKELYKAPVGSLEYVEVTKEVYELLTTTFPKEEHAQKMRDLRHLSMTGYTEGETEELLCVISKELEETVLKKIEIEELRRAIQSLSKIQKERIYLYFFEGMTVRKIAEYQGVNRNAVWKSIQNALVKIRSGLIE